MYGHIQTRRYHQSITLELTISAGVFGIEFQKIRENVYGYHEKVHLLSYVNRAVFLINDTEI
jgi:hypothetical protein